MMLACQSDCCIFICDVYVFQYLGCVEVYESRGMQVCEEAVKALKQVRRHVVYQPFIIVRMFHKPCFRKIREYGKY